MKSKKISAIIWDFDSTLADTKQKNLNVTKKILKKVTGKDSCRFSILDSLEKYFYYNTRTNWRKFYADSFMMSEPEIDEAGRLWTEYQQNDNTEINLYTGIVEIIEKFGDVPHGVFSMNSRDVIKNVLADNYILEYFHSIIGYEEVGINQKPKPDGMLMCINELSVDNGTIFYIGDMECDIQCTANVNKILNDKKMKVKIVNICSRYDSVQEPQKWNIMPDYMANTVNQIGKIICEYSE